MKSLLILDDDKEFSKVLASAFTARGFEVRTASSIEDALVQAKDFEPEYCITDLKMPGGSGLLFISKILEIDLYTKIVVLTGYASVNTAVEAIKLGATHYLCKPVGIDEILAAFEKDSGDPHISVTEELPTLNQLEAEHIKSALERNMGNISATARDLKIHRRTLQRKITKLGLTLPS